MKKLFSLLLVALLAACSSAEESGGETKKEEPKAATEEKSDAANEEKGLEVDKGLLNVQITIPASFMEGENTDTAIEEAKANGIKEVAKNDDGSITYKMSKSEHKKMLKELQTTMTESMDEIKNDKEIASIKDITHNKDFSEFTLVVDQEAYENSFDSIAIYGLGISGMYYQLFDGASPENYKVNIDVKDEASGKVFSEIIFPDDLEDEAE